MKIAHPTDAPGVAFVATDCARCDATHVSRVVVKDALAELNAPDFVALLHTAGVPKTDPLFRSATRAVRVQTGVDLMQSGWSFRVDDEVCPRCAAERSS